MAKARIAKPSRIVKQFAQEGTDPAPKPPVQLYSVVITVLANGNRISTTGSESEMTALFNSTVRTGYCGIAPSGLSVAMIRPDGSTVTMRKWVG